MLVGRVTGNVVSSTKSEHLKGLKMLIVMPLNIETMEEKNDPVICLDFVGAGEGDVVMCVAGSSSRQTPESRPTPSDNAILAILDTIDIRGERKYEKFVKE